MTITQTIDVTSSDAPKGWLDKRDTIGEYGNIAFHASYSQAKKDVEKGRIHQFAGVDELIEWLKKMAKKTGRQHDKENPSIIQTTSQTIQIIEGPSPRNLEDYEPGATRTEVHNALRKSSPPVRQPDPS